MDRLSRLGSPLVLAVPLACVRPPLTGACPEVQVGDLVLTEFRQDQPGSYRQWIEVHNASEEPLALAGIRVAFTRNDGDPYGAFVVRDPGLELEPGGYAVFGSDDPAVAPYLDYGYLAEFHSDSDTSEAKALPVGGIIDVYACDVLIDRVVLRNLFDPKDPERSQGTFFWPGEPSAEANDEGADWCLDNFTLSTGIGVFGTPGEANPPCP